MNVSHLFLQPFHTQESFSSFHAGGLSITWPLWPEAEDKALRGRNLSAVFRTLYRQGGKPLLRLPSCAHTWRVENQCDKSTVRPASRLRADRAPPKRSRPARLPAKCRLVPLSADILRRATHRHVVG